MAPARKSCTNRGEEIENKRPGPKGQRLMARKKVGAGQGQPDLGCLADLRRGTPAGFLRHSAIRRINRDNEYET